MKTSKIFLLAAMIASLGVSACNTVQGAGTDIKKTGNAIENTADKSKP